MSDKKRGLIVTRPDSGLPPLARSGDETWDLPPEMRTYRDEPEQDTRDAERDAREARRRGDKSFEIQRETDVRVQRQTRWDWGDGRTWAILIAVTAYTILITLSNYYLPAGQHASPPMIKMH